MCCAAAILDFEVAVNQPFKTEILPPLEISDWELGDLNFKELKPINSSARINQAKSNVHSPQSDCRARLHCHLKSNL